MLSSRHLKRMTLSEGACSSSSEVLPPGGGDTTGVLGWQVYCHLAPVMLSSNGLAPGHSPKVNCMMLPSQQQKIKAMLISGKSPSRHFCKAKRTRYILDRQNPLHLAPQSCPRRGQEQQPDCWCYCPLPPRGCIWPLEKQSGLWPKYRSCLWFFTAPLSIRALSPRQWSCFSSQGASSCAQNSLHQSWIKK